MRTTVYASVLTLVAASLNLAFAGCSSSAADNGDSTAGGATAGASTTASTGGANPGTAGAGAGAGAGAANFGTAGAGAGGTNAGTAGTNAGTAGTNAGTAGAGGANSGTAGAGGASTGTCTASQAANTRGTGSGSHQVVVETNSDAGIKEGTIYRPKDLGGTEKYPIFVWGEGGCSLDGASNATAMGEIASHGYFVIADGTPGNSASRTMDTSNPAAMGAPLLAYISWAIAENDKPCSAYYHAIDTTKVASNGFSCGGLMSEGTASDPRMTTWGLNSSGLFSANPTFYKTVHTPVLIVLGGSSDIAYANGERDYDGISALGGPIMLFSKNLGHGGDLFSAKGGDFTKIDLAWLNWQLKGDLTATGKGVLVGSTCTYCSDSAWEVKSSNIQ